MDSIILLFILSYTYDKPKKNFIDTFIPILGLLWGIQKILEAITELLTSISNL